jgi:hypothetical protein
MRLTFDPRKSKRLRANPKRGIGFEEAQETFYRPYWLDSRSDVPRNPPSRHALGPRRRKSDCMKRTLKSAKPVAAEAIAKMADRGKDISHFFKGEGRLVQPIQRVNVDLTAGMLEELDKAAQELNVSRQAVIKTLVRQALDQHYLAQSARRPTMAS